MWLQSVVGSTTVEAGASVASTFDEKERMDFTDGNVIGKGL